MSDGAKWIINKLNRMIEDSKVSKGMTVGMPKLNIDRTWVEHLLKHYEALKAERDALKAERDALRAEVESFYELVNESHGVVGWHLSGNVATWDELGYTKEDE